jgi:hypothetical protein
MPVASHDSRYTATGVSTLVVLSRLQQRPPLAVVESVRALPRVAGSWVAASSPETRVLHEGLRLHEVGLEVRASCPSCAAARGRRRLQPRAPATHVAGALCSVVLSV